MSSATCPTLSMVLPVLDALHDCFRNLEGGLDGLPTIFVDLIGEKFGDFYTDEELVVATLDDPRSKAILFNSPEDRKRAINWTVKAMDAAANSGGDATPLTAPVTVPTTSTATSVSDSTLKVSLIYARLERVKATTSSSTTGAVLQRRSVESLQQEIEQYLSYDIIDRESCPLKWWAENHLRFPCVADVVRNLLGIPATSVPSEILFSKVGDVITKKQNCLAPSKAEKVIFLMENL